MMVGATVKVAPRYAPTDPTLLPPWRALVDGKIRYIYYWNPESSVTQYDNPLPLVGYGPPLPSSPPPSSITFGPKLVVIPNRADQLNRDSENGHTAGLNGDCASAVEAMPEQQSKLAATLLREELRLLIPRLLPWGYNLATSSSATPPSDGADNDEFTKALKTTGKDGCFGIRGEYRLKADLYEGFPQYKKIGVDPKKRRQRPFLTNLNTGLGCWVFFDWDEFLLLGPVADKQAGPKGPDKYEGKYEVCRNVKHRCKGVVKIKVAPVKIVSNVATTSYSYEQLLGQIPVKNASSVATLSSSANKSPRQIHNYEVCTWPLLNLLLVLIVCASLGISL